MLADKVMLHGFNIPADVPIKTKEVARLAPDVMPKTSGPARAFLKSVCICRPLTDSALPASTQVRAFGRRKFQTTLARTGSCSSPSNIENISETGIWMLPDERLTAKTKIKIAGSPIHLTIDIKLEIQAQ
jgi:hypothetical protein